MRFQIFRKELFILLIGFLPIVGVAQIENDTTIRLDNVYLDSMFIGEIENRPGLKAKVLHAEPLYIDLIRDLGARKGEKEWNYGFGMKTDRNFDEYEALVEYEWAPVDRLGLEIEVPLTFYGPSPADPTKQRPSNRLESLKLAAQWSFFVSEKWNTSMALGYIHEFELVDLNKIRREDIFKGNSYNPFFVIAKRWGLNYHTLIYTGPRLIKEFDSPNWERVYEINTNFHYMISGTRNFIGIELNQEAIHGKVYSVIRPQMRIGLSENLMIGIVSGIPLNRENRGLSSFARLIYEPGFKAMH